MKAKLFFSISIGFHWGSLIYYYNGNGYSNNSVNLSDSIVEGKEKNLLLMIWNNKEPIETSE